VVTSLLYVSRSTLLMPDQIGEIDAIVEVARSRNAALDVTGALVFTRLHFAQILEGSAAAVDELMRSIEADPRHTDVDVVDVRDSSGRHFAGWSLAYTGFSTRIDQPISEIADRRSDAGLEAKTRRLRRLMVELAIPTG
jgi:hypothetical protein